jgi:hypothetical protein
MFLGSLNTPQEKLSDASSERMEKCGIVEEIRIGLS